MDEELSEAEIEERLYAMLHHVDQAQAEVNIKTNQDDASRLVASVQRKTEQRYWDTNNHHSFYHKTNSPKVTSIATNKQTTKAFLGNNNKNSETAVINKPKLKDKTVHEVLDISDSEDLTMLQSPVSKNVKKIIEIIDSDTEEQKHHTFEVQTSDDDEVVEVALPPKPTITIESSDDESQVVPDKTSPVKEVGHIKEKNNTSGRDHSTSPVPSSVSSVSDEFIRGDCIALHISSRHPNNPTFDFSLHGSDLIDQSSSFARKRKGNSAEQVTSTPLVDKTASEKSTIIKANEYFATPKSKSKKEKTKNKSYLMTQKSLPNPDVYDLDNNQLVFTNKKDSYSVTEVSIPSNDVNDSCSSHAGTIEKSRPIPTDASTPIHKYNVTSTSDVDFEEIWIQPDTSGKKTESCNLSSSLLLIEDNNNDDNATIDENISIGNVSGFTLTEQHEDTSKSVSQNNVSTLGSTKVPAILYEDLDFNNLKEDKSGTVTRTRKYSLRTLREEMEKFYNESWGGENFNHREIQKSMSRDKNLWAIDPKDRIPSMIKRKVTCNYCNRKGHRDDNCYQKPPICFMCGHAGHYEPRCPRKICVNCGSPNQMYSNMCKNCAEWGHIKCPQCFQFGHPASHCPDVWRRYHNTIDTNTPLEENHQFKKGYQLYCSGCSRRGHLINTCRVTVPFSGLPIYSPYVYSYRKIYADEETNNSTNYDGNGSNNSSRYFQASDISSANSSFMLNRNKRQSKSPTCHETHVNKKKNVSISEDNPQNRDTRNNDFQKVSQYTEPVENLNSVSKETNKDVINEKTESHLKSSSKVITIYSPTHNENGQVIQDNEVSDTSDVITSATIFIGDKIINKMKTKEGEEWLKDVTKKHNITVEHTDSSFIRIKGRVGDQESFHNEIREWTIKQTLKINGIDCNTTESTIIEEHPINLIPKSKNALRKKLYKSLNSLKKRLGDPKIVYDRLLLLLKHHEQLLKNDIVNPIKVAHSRYAINKTVIKLNTILLGKAGLADGFQHLNVLNQFLVELRQHREKNLPPSFLSEFEKHYNYIFTAVQRDDYTELLEKYASQQDPQMHEDEKRFKEEKNKRKERKRAERCKKMGSLLDKPVVNKNNTKTVSSLPTRPTNNRETSDPDKMNKKFHFKKLERVIGRLHFYRNRLLRTSPANKANKKTQIKLARKLFAFISSLNTNMKVSAKTMKKIVKAQEQAELFLTNEEMNDVSFSIDRS